MVVKEVDHAGDGFFVAFPDPTAALECAVSIQRRLAAQRREHGFAPRVRIGVHEASRIAALAGPDEIVASRATVPAGFPMSEPRELKVKGISRPLEVVTVHWSR